MFKTKLAVFISGIAIAILAGVFIPMIAPIGELPYAYFQVMNWVVMLAAAIRVSEAFDKKMLFGVLAFGSIAIAFNPFSPLYLSSLVWTVLDILAIICFLSAIWLMKKAR